MSMDADHRSPLSGTLTAESECGCRFSAQRVALCMDGGHGDSWGLRGTAGHGAEKVLARCSVCCQSAQVMLWFSMGHKKEIGVVHTVTIQHTHNDCTNYHGILEYS